MLYISRFYEWLSKGKDKIPYFVKYKPQDGKERLMLMAGLYDTIKSVLCSDAMFLKAHTALAVAPGTKIVKRPSKHLPSLQLLRIPICRSYVT